MKRLVLWMALFCIYLQGAEFGYGGGSYKVDMGIKGFMKHDLSYDMSVLKLSQPPTDIVSYPLYYYYVDAELFFTEDKRADTYFTNLIADENLPIIGSPNENLQRFSETFYPVEGDYEGVGFDLDFGIGYKILKKGENFLGVALNSGASLPNISAKNLKEKIKFAYKMIKKWDLDVGTYKIGSKVDARVAISEEFFLEGNYGFGFQKAYIECDMFKSDVDSKGSYSNFNIDLIYKPKGVTSVNDNLYIKLGYTIKKWSVDSVDVNLFNFFEADMMRPFEIDLKERYIYVSVGYKF
jgi:hypothetical protein